jgi:hypothetical protein
MSDRERTADSTEQGRRGPSVTPQRLISAGLAVLGLGLAATGIVAVFTTESDTGAAALLAVGTILVLFIALGDRLESLRYGDLEIVLRRKADEAARRGDVEGARALERAADTVGKRAARLARSYTNVRGSMPAGPERTRLMERIISEARSDAYAPDLDEEEVLKLLWTGSEGARVWALAVLQERPELATTRAVLEAVQRPDQPFDRYHALLLAEKVILRSATPIWTRERIAAAVRTQLDSGALGKDDDSIEAAKRILKQVPLPR